ncbi:HPr-rel-A system PqqD family peptide chaperone [Blastomonas sp.]|uniref:HPr-rel-A system PqqD family peptide chaperone n=1 Tax=Blastomonas sp. TaxID=1909299 RepID=UPI00260DC643|nr:HPr-rel-A system PqqD family peptide chaperone [Blastomonas sp.]MDM7956448.1 HPr-rel-A system PqqD family peptide chaperone [Blastomonas sp.]
MSVLRFAALPETALKRVPLGGLEAIYHVPSGITHLLAEPVPDLLDALARLGPGKAASAAEVLVAVAERFDIVGDDPGEAPVAVVAERLAELAQLGLVAVRHDA